MTPVRRFLATVASALLALGAMGGPAEAAAYRYWSYWHGEDGRWTYATTGPGGHRPTDGAVEGWRFAVSTEGGGVGPRQPADFAAVCGDTPATEGRKQVALVLDFGTPQDAPPGERPPPARALCVLTAREASGADVLAAVRTRYGNGGLLCGIEGYPERECGVPVADPSVPATAAGEAPANAGDIPATAAGRTPASNPAGDAGTPTGALVGGALALLVGAAVALRWHRAKGGG